MAGRLADAQLSCEYLLGRVALLEARARAVVEHRRASDPDPDDRFRGLYVSDEHVDQLLSPDRSERLPPGADPQIEQLAAYLEQRADAVEGESGELRLRRLARTFELSAFDVELLLVAVAPDLDPRFEKIYGYLNDDVTRRRASIGLALELCGARPIDGVARSRLGSGAPLIAGELLVVEDTDRPFLTRSLRVPDRVTAYLLGDDTPDEALDRFLVSFVPVDDLPIDPVLRALAGGSRLMYARESVGAPAFSFLGTALVTAGVPVVAVDLALMDPRDDPATVAAVAAREARLQGGALLAAHVDALVERGPGEVRALADSPALVVLTGSRGWDPRWSRRPPLVVEAAPATDRQRQGVWKLVTQGDPVLEDGIREGLAAYRLTPEQAAMAADSARQHATAAGHPLVIADLQAGARGQNSAGLERLARRISPRADRRELVLPGPVELQLRSIGTRVRQRSRVLDDWGMGGKSSRGRGVTVLFSGDSGTGKTMSAEVLANSLGLDLYVIDLSTVVDKYIGETEKNLDRIFDEAERVNGVLLFDEADAIFGKRSEVRDARDRYANVEVAYLLQRMEQFEGMAILTTNLRANVDEAFLRRLDVLAEFPMPDPASRRRLWLQQFREGVPRTGDIDFDFLAQAFELSGGNIRNIVLAAAYLAADRNQPVSMGDLIRSTAEEYRKLGRLCVETEFGPYYRHIAPVGVAS